MSEPRGCGRCARWVPTKSRDSAGYRWGRCKAIGLLMHERDQCEAGGGKGFEAKEVADNVQQSSGPGC